MTKQRALAAAARVIARCREIATYSETAGATSRPFLCDSAREVQSLVRGWMERAGMAVRVDDAGNLRGVYEGIPGSGGRRLLLGSHLDTVPNAGAFDGVLGVVLAVAVLEELQGERIPFAVEVIGFSEEEGVRFGRPFLGSMAVVGRLDAATLALRDREGVCVADALGAFGLDPSRLPEATGCREALGFLEVHIEQGPVLEEENRALGVVDAIAGQTRLLVRFKGRANHAGTTPMRARQDPMAAAAEWIVAVEARANAVGGLVATNGRVEVTPGAANVIAGEVTATLDVRHALDAVRTEAVAALSEMAHEAGRRRGVLVTLEVTMEQAAVPLDRQMADMLGQAATRAGHAVKRMTSGAGHDAMVMTEIVSSAMLFVRSPGGVSHHPDESVRVEDVAAAVETVMEFIKLLRDDGTDRVTHHA